MAIISIAGIDKATLLSALYNGAVSPDTVSARLRFDPNHMSREEALKHLGLGDDAAKMFPGFQSIRNPQKDLYFDYLKGRVMKVDLTGDEMDTWGYNRDNGEGAAEKIVAQLLDEMFARQA